MDQIGDGPLVDQKLSSTCNGDSHQDDKLRDQRQRVRLKRTVRDRTSFTRLARRFVTVEGLCRNRRFDSRSKDKVIQHGQASRFVDKEKISYGNTRRVRGRCANQMKTSDRTETKVSFSSKRIPKNGENRHTDSQNSSEPSPCELPAHSVGSVQGLDAVERSGGRSTHGFQFRS